MAKFTTGFRKTPATSWTVDGVHWLPDVWPDPDVSEASQPWPRVGTRMTATAPATEHRLRLASSASLATVTTPGHPLVLIVSEGGKSFASIDLLPEEIDMVIRLLQSAKTP